MEKLRFLPALMLLLLGAVGFTGCNDDDDDVAPTRDIVEFLAADSDYSLLVAAVTKAELTTVLSGTGPFTVFAPNNAALQAFLDAAGTGSIENTPKEVLAAILAYHVVPGNFDSGSLSNGYANTLSNTRHEEGVLNSIYINTDNGVTINGVADVTRADLEVTNGVIHAVDNVIPLPTVVTFVAADPSFSLLLEALTTTGLATNFVEALSGDGPFTVFAPTNAAFQALLATNPAWTSVADIPKDLLDRVLRYHVTAAGNVRSNELTNGQQVNTLANETFTINLAGNAAGISTPNGTANIIFVNVQANNGVVHVIDRVLLPE